jgi:acyl carrier protein
MIEKFDIGMAELFEVDSVNESDILEEFEAWDSLTSLSIIAFVDENYGISLSAKDLLEAKTINGLKTLIESRANRI